MVGTEENLGEAFAVESQANCRYILFAQKAQEEGFPQVAKVFTAAAESEMIHAQCEMRVLGGIADTRTNLREAIRDESFEHIQMYPEYIEQAKNDGDREARLCFSYAKAVEKRHEGMFTELLRALDAGENPEVRRLYVCQVCGNVEVNSPPITCPVCGNPKQVFKEVR